MTRTAILAVLPIFLAGSAAFAEATDDGAAHLTEVFQSYLGATEGVVSVEVDGDDYALTIDVAPLMALAAQSGGTATVTPMEMTLTDNGDGTWDVVQDQSMSIAFTVPDMMDVSKVIGSVKSEGVFDEALMSFTSAKGEMTDIKVTEKVTQPGPGEMSIDMSIASGTFEMTGVAGASGGVDNTISLVFNNLTQTITTPALDGMPAMPFTITAQIIAQSGKIDGMRPDAFFATAAWFVANPTVEAKEADKASLKTIIQNGIPFFSMMTMNGSVKNMTVATPLGLVGIAELGIAVDLNGLVADGKVREAISVSGLTLPEGLVPAWAVPILPQKASFDFQVTDFDAAAAANLALGLFDLPGGASPDDAFNAAVLKAFMPKGTVTIGLNPSSVTGDGYELTYEGSMVAGPDTTIPTGTAKITLTGIEKLQAALAAAPDDMKAQAMMGVGMAQGLATPGENGALVWEIDASTPGTVLVNGTAMMGGN